MSPDLALRRKVQAARKAADDAEHAHTLTLRTYYAASIKYHEARGPEGDRKTLGKLRAAYADTFRITAGITLNHRARRAAGLSPHAPSDCHLAPI